MKSSFSPIAIVGFSGVFPDAPDMDIFWQNILHKKSSARAIPKSRIGFDPARMFSSSNTPDTIRSLNACLIDHFNFDPFGFNLPSSLLAKIDPMFQLLLHSARSALEAIPHKKEKTGAILSAIALPTEGASRFSTQILHSLMEASIFDESISPPDFSVAQLLSAKVTGLPSALVCKALGLESTSYTIDAACASSIYTLYLACLELQSHRADMMLSGGVSRPDCLYTQVGFSQLQALSPTGTCSPFDEKADGLVVGEGSGVFVLKRLEDAISDQNIIYGIIRGIGLSNDTRGNLLAPEVAGQVRAMKKAYQQAAWKPSEVDLIECHGTGTPIGDQIELSSLRKLWEEDNWQIGQCAIGSVKSMIGHLLTAAGAAGLCKILLAMQHETLPPSLNFSKPPPKSALVASPFRVQTKNTPWEKRSPNTPRRAALSSFGFGGINGHVLIEEYLPSKSSDIKDLYEFSPIAIIGMDAYVGNATTLADFEQVVFDGIPLFNTLPKGRWKNIEKLVENIFFQSEAPHGAYIDRLSFHKGQFQIPPTELPDILPQHILMLQVAERAMKDANLSSQENRENMGAFIGIDFDMDACNFHFRWHLTEIIKEIIKRHSLQFSSQEIDTYVNTLQSHLFKPLTHTRTQGALGGLIASRVARACKFGGASFTLSDDAAGGLKALEAAIHLLQAKDLDIALAGAVSLTGEFRTMILQHQTRPYHQKEVSSFDIASDASLPIEGAVALVLKPLKVAQRDQNKIYAIIQGLSSASGGAIDLIENTLPPVVLQNTIRNVLTEPKITPHYTSSLKIGADINLQAGAQQTHKISQKTVPDELLNIASTTTSTIAGNTGAILGLLGLVKASLLFGRKKIALTNSHKPMLHQQENNPFHMPIKSLCWVSNQKLDFRHVAVFQETQHGTATSVLLSANNDSPVVSFEKNVSVSTKLSDITTIKTSVYPFSQIPKPTSSYLKKEVLSQNLSKATQLNIKNPFSFLLQHVDQIRCAHEIFLTFTAQNTERIKRILTDTIETAIPPFSPSSTIFDRDMCMEFAIGSIEKVFGSRFKIIDTYPVRVRLPDEPLMLVDRITHISGQKGTPGPGKIITEHDVHKNAWYLDANRAPVCITVEAGQADLFLSSYLGIDFKVQGKRAYRLLDATITFYRHLPIVGETIRYEIEIEKFVCQGDTWLFFFHFNGYIGNKLILEMRNGCAGFFTAEEVEQSGGILSPTFNSFKNNTTTSSWPTPRPIADEKYNEDAINAIREGNLGKAFGPEFADIILPESLRLPKGRMHLIDRILSLSAIGGSYGLGKICGEADIHPDDWFLTCHFVDDKVMPGTLMYECCSHTLRIFLLRMGWIIANPETGFEPLLNTPAALKCRGPVTVNTRKVRYEITIREIGSSPEPYVIADAHMFADNHCIVEFTNMSLRLTHVSAKEIDSFWENRKEQTSLQLLPQSAIFSPAGICLDQIHFHEFSEGSPSKAFGAAYKVFDHGRFLARLPRSPYAFVHRVTQLDPPPGVISPDGWVTAQVDVSKNDWFFTADRTSAMPFCILLEIALQPCGWLAAYMGSAFASNKPLHFRNLDGKAILYREIPLDDICLTMRCRLTKASNAGEMLIQTYDMEVLDKQGMIYEGSTTFGFFTPEVLSTQIGIQNAPLIPVYTTTQKSFEQLEKTAPLSPFDSTTSHHQALCMPAAAIEMINEIVHCEFSFHTGTIHARKWINPDEWFFRAHFFDDPVCPGSLGIESFLQALRYAALQKWPKKIDTHKFSILTGTFHEWSYRGQILQKNERVDIISTFEWNESDNTCEIIGNGYLYVDDLCIYQLKNFGLRLMPIKDKLNT